MLARLPRVAILHDAASLWEVFHENISSLHHSQKDALQDIPLFWVHRFAVDVREWNCSPQCPQNIQ